MPCGASFFAQTGKAEISKHALNHTISGTGMWAIAAMAATPSLMGIGIAYFMTKKIQSG
jgi:hypothetical protein